MAPYESEQHSVLVEVASDLVDVGVLACLSWLKLRDRSLDPVSDDELTQSFHRACNTVIDTTSSALVVEFYF